MVEFTQSMTTWLVLAAALLAREVAVLVSPDEELKLKITSSPGLIRPVRGSK
jgi:hypothetical protein